MPQSRFWKDLPVPVRWLFRPWLLVALGLHAVLLAVPLPENPGATDISDETVEGIRLVTLPPAPPPVPEPSVAVIPAPVVAPPAPSLTPVAPPQIRPTAPPPPAKPAEPVATAPSPAATPTPTPTPLPEASVSPPPPEPEITIQPSPDPLAAIPEVANFPHLTDSAPSCGGQAGCWQTGNTHWRGVAMTLEQDLQSRGYMIDQLELADDTGIRVYAVSKAGEIAYYLNLLSTFEGTVYIVSEQPMTREELNAMVGVQS